MRPSPRSSGPRNVCWTNSTVRHARRSAAAAGQAGTTIRRFHPRRRSRNRRETAQFERRRLSTSAAFPAVLFESRLESRQNVVRFFAARNSRDAAHRIHSGSLHHQYFAQNPSDFSDNLVESDGTSPYRKLTLIKNSHNLHLSARHSSLPSQSSIQRDQL